MLELKQSCSGVPTVSEARSSDLTHRTHSRFTQQLL